MEKEEQTKIVEENKKKKEEDPEAVKEIVNQIENICQEHEITIKEEPEKQQGEER